MNENKTYFHGLNSLRFLAATAIVVYHTGNGRENLDISLKLCIKNLPLAVDFFFLISGFLIVYLLMQERAKKQKINLLNFYIRRFLRIFPLYFLVVGIAYTTYHHSNPEVDFIKYTYFWGNFWLIETSKWTVGMLNPLWSICIEEHFYLIVPLLMLFFSNKNLHYLFFGIIAISIFFRFYAFFTVEYNWMTMYAHTLSRCDVLAIGGLLAYYHFHHTIQFNFKGYLLLIPVIYLAMLMGTADSVDFTNLFFATFKKYLFILPLFLILIGVIFNNNTFITKYLENPIFNYLGKISYGIYMFHSVVIDLLLRQHLYPKAIFLQIPIVLIGTIAVASLSFFVFEQPLLNIKNKFG